MRFIDSVKIPFYIFAYNYLPTYTHIHTYRAACIYSYFVYFHFTTAVYIMLLVPSFRQTAEEEINIIQSSHNAL